LEEVQVIPPRRDDPEEIKILDGNDNTVPSKAADDTVTMVPNKAADDTVTTDKRDNTNPAKNLHPTPGVRIYRKRQSGDH
jgi:hypothetical protein